MKVIFLDIDGVLNSFWFFEGRDMLGDPRHGDPEWWAEAIDAQAVQHLNELVLRSGSAVVVSSAWRQSCSPRFLQSVLTSVGFIGLVHSSTPVAPVLTRGQEIARWLSSHPEVTEYVILDDEPIGHPGLVGRLIRTDAEVGLTPGDVEKAITLLDEEQPK